jgi:hypothetical protein
MMLVLVISPMRNQLVADTVLKKDLLYDCSLK